MEPSDRLTQNESKFSLDRLFISINFSLTQSSGLWAVKGFNLPVVFLVDPGDLFFDDLYSVLWNPQTCEED